MASKQLFEVIGMAWIVCIITNAVCSKQLTHFSVIHDVTLQQVLTSSRCVSAQCTLGCFAECEGDPGCNAFSISSQKDGVCYLHSADSSSASITAVGTSLYMLKCMTGWYVYGKACYLFNGQSENWYMAMATCESMGANLIKIETAEENDFMKERAAENGAGAYWIGGRYFSEYNDHRWADETDLSITDFAPGSTVGSGCMDILQGSGYGWNVHWDCHNTYLNSICEKDGFY